MKVTSNPNSFGSKMDFSMKAQYITNTEAWLDKWTYFMFVIRPTFFKLLWNTLWLKCYQTWLCALSQVDWW